MSSESASIWAACESRLLERLLYKYNNQHRKTPYFHKLQQVRRALRAVDAEVRRCVRDAEAEGAADPDAEEPASDEDVIAALLYPRSAAHMARLDALVHSLISSQRIILHCSRPLYGLLSQTYFMSFALAALALLARLYATQRVMLLPLLDKCNQARTPASSAAAGGRGNYASLSFAQLLHRAMRTETGEREWMERCATLDDVFAPCTDANLAAPLMSAKSAAGGDGTQLIAAAKQLPVSHHHSDGDSDEEDEIMAPAVLPAQLKFFASPAATAKPVAQPLRTPVASATPVRPTTAVASKQAGGGSLPASPSPAAVAATPQRSLKRPAAAALTPMSEGDDDDDDGEDQSDHDGSSDHLEPGSDDDGDADVQQPAARKPATAPAVKPVLPQTAAKAAAVASSQLQSKNKKQQQLSKGTASPLPVAIPASPSSAAAATATPPVSARPKLPLNAAPAAPKAPAAAGTKTAVKPAPSAAAGGATSSLQPKKKKARVGADPLALPLSAEASDAAPSAQLALLTRTIPLSGGGSGGDGASPPVAAKPKLKKKKLKSSSSRSDEMDDIFG